jgi:hypothetical protein
METYKNLCETGDPKDVEVLKRLVGMSVRPAFDYLERVVFRECGDQMSRLAASRVLDPLHVMAAGVNESGVDKLVARYRFFTLPSFVSLPEAIKNELPSSRAAAAEIKPFAERKDADGSDTFDIEAWWRANEPNHPAWVEVLGAVLCHVPNSAPPERACFTILNDSIGDDQYHAKAGYKKSLMQLKYNGRVRGN